MPDDPQPIGFEMHTVYVVRDWPQVTTFVDDFLRNPHTRHATYDDASGTVTFDVFNGGAQYLLDPPTLSTTGAPTMRVGRLVEGSVKKTSRRP
jgi:hypothetical protein